MTSNSKDSVFIHSIRHCLILEGGLEFARLSSRKPTLEGETSPTTGYHNWTVMILSRESQPTETNFKLCIYRRKDTSVRSWRPEAAVRLEASCIEHIGKNSISNRPRAVLRYWTL